MRVLINGKPEELGDAGTVGDLVRQFELVPRRIAIEVNEQLVPRDTFDDVVLADGDRVEIVTFVGGGTP